MCFNGPFLNVPNICKCHKWTCNICFYRSHFGSRYKLGCCGHAGLFLCFAHAFQETNIELEAWRTSTEYLQFIVRAHPRSHYKLRKSLQVLEVVVSLRCHDRDPFRFIYQFPNCSNVCGHRDSQTLRNFIFCVGPGPTPLGPGPTPRGPGPSPLGPGPTPLGPGPTPLIMYTEK